MKKHILLFAIAILSCLQVAAIGLTTNMNPFAYNLSATLSADQSELTIKYCLNADVTSLKIVIEGDGQTITHNVTEASKLQRTVAADPYLEATAPYAITISTQNLPTSTELSWHIEVTGAGRSTTQVYSADGTNVYRYKFYRPSSVDIVMDPTSYNYGKVLVVEGNDDARNNTGYHSSPMTKTKGTNVGGNDPQGAGIYVFNPDFTSRENTSGTYVFNGKSDNRLKGTVYAPHRVRVSEDGRIFVTSMYYNGDILWEIPETFGTWKLVMGKGVGGATFSTSTYELKTSGGSFIAGPVAGFDVRGKGANLQLLMLSCGYEAFKNSWQSKFLTYEYNLGTAETWSKAPSKNFYTHSQIFLQPQYSQVQYDKDGGIWCSQYYGSYTDTYPALVHIPRSVTATGTRDYVDKTSVPIQNAGFRYNHDFSKAIIAKKGSSGAEGHIYRMGKNASGKPTIDGTGEPQIDMSAIGPHVNDFAWDNANNIYAVGQDNASKGGTGYVAVYCLPYSNTDVFTTPGPTTLTIDCNPTKNYTVNTSVNDASMGSATGGGTFVSCSDVTLIAKSKGGYRFVNWTENDVEVSQDSTYTFALTRNANLKANFAVNVFDVTWHNLFQNHQDITDGLLANPSIDTYTNHRLWRLFQVEYAKYVKDKRSADLSDGGTITGEANTPTAYNEWNVMQFLYSQGSNSIITETKGYINNSSNAFYWLKQYILDKTGHTQAQMDATGYNYWGYYLYMFINRTSKPYNMSGAKVTVADYFNQSFVEIGKPQYWRPYWTRIACELPDQMNFESQMPKQWTTRDITDHVVTQSYKPQSWHKWNDQAANPDKLLAWYYDDPANPTWPTNPTIVRHVDHSGALFATWVEKRISENEDNSDAIWLLNHHDGTHIVQVERKLQANMYNTICLPFSINKSQLEFSDLEDATIMEFTGVTEDTYDESGESVVVLNFTEVNQMEAGKPYLIKPNKDITEDQPITTVISGYTNDGNPIIKETPSATSIATNNGSITFHAVINPSNIPAESIILVANNRLAETSTNGELKGLRGYFTIDDLDLQSIAKAGRMYLSVKKPVTTSVPLAPEAEKQVAPKARKIMRDGQIYILRGDEVYTVTGHRVK